MQKDHYTLSFKFICRASMSYKNISYNKQQIFIPNLIQYLCSYITSCHICQLACNEKPPTRQLQTRINLKYRPLSRLSMDLKVMPR